MKNAILVISCALMLMTPALAAAQINTGQATTTMQPPSTSPVTMLKPDPPQQGPRFVRTLTNVQIELTLSDQAGTQPPVKKTVSMIVSSGNWGKIRSAGTIRPIGDSPFAVDLNVDARPFVSVEGPIQLELTLVYSPPRMSATSTENANAPAGVNQSLTVVLQSGKPLTISQAADPVSDRKIIVEVKATVLK
jgi:hypothetical protein